VGRQKVEAQKSRSASNKTVKMVHSAHGRPSCNEGIAGCKTGTI
jgi:hypothetical protein